MNCDLNFLEVCKALQEKKCTTIENEFGTQYTTNKHGTLTIVTDPESGMKRAPGGFLLKWRMVDKKPVEHEEVIENVIRQKKKRDNMAKAINIIIDEGRPPNVDFVEIETDDGRSINIGERISDGNYTKIRITIEDIKKAR